MIQSLSVASSPRLESKQASVAIALSSTSNSDRWFAFEQKLPDNSKFQTRLLSMTCRIMNQLFRSSTFFQRF
ncbi:MAG: hypothetical protein V7K47_09950 [Nostoc sp.]